MKQLEVKILGQSYLLGCPEGGEARMLLAVERVDGAMCAIRDAGRIKARDRIAVLAALNLAFDQSTPPATEPGAEAPGDQQAALAAIVARLDEALGDDGRLL
ncbi:cell division protein ZapA [Pseudorhodoferax sp. Leaf267]|uniref:cell division protein ZapA n=1 Tax=Pseudorhodoferax sp. Leaf267 TaxID=1736316 RepID=UPI0006FBAA9B|nr:cell division protein ZapA [Pseudorhodoferax sp. Leaf267]KQP22848.1 cell division protein ZapA [Pseudorhodoferax sp. Leaf267]